MKFNTPTFAVIQVNDEALDPVAAARLLAETLDIPVADLIAKLAISGGILAENLSEVESRQSAAALTNGGIAVRIISNEALIDPPPPCVLRSANFQDNEMTFTTISQSSVDSEGSIRWSEFRWLDCVSVQTLGKEEFEDWEFQGDEGARVTRFKCKRLTVKRPLQIDLDSYEPWQWLQIREEGFQFAATKLSMRPTRRENIYHLAIVLGLRATSAHLGPGMKWFSDQTALREARLPNATVHYNHLRWQLTRLWLDS